MKPTDNLQRILVTGAGGFLGKYVMRQLELSAANAAVETLGLAADNNYIVDLTSSAPQLPSTYSTVLHLVGSCTAKRCHDVNVVATENLLKMLEACPTRELVYISSTQIYGRSSGEDFNEATIPDPQTAVGEAKLAAEQMLQSWCDARGVTLSILRCPAIIGTGMQGTMRDIVNRIYRGSYYHIEGNEARTSVVHAVDVAYAAVAIAPIGGIYNLTDGVNPTHHDLADALATRISNKRVLTLRLKRATTWAKVNDLLPFSSFNSAMLKAQTTTLTFSSDKLFEKLNWRPNSVTDYLRNHVYDENSL